MTEISSFFGRTTGSGGQPGSNPSIGWMRLGAAALSRVSPRLAAALLARAFTTPVRHRMPNRELGWLNQAATSRFRLGDGTIVPIYAWYPKKAERGRALMRQTPVPTVLLVHGLSGRGVQMGSFAAPLTQLGYRVVSFDAPGHGVAGGKRLSLPEAASAVRQVADHIGPLAGVIAHSNGAAATLVAMSQGMVAGKAVLISPPENLSRYLLRMAEFLEFTPGVATLAQSRLEARHGVRFDDLRGGLLVKDLPGEALIFHDQRDRMVPFEDGETLARAWVGARLVPVNGLGHNRILRDPCVINSTARFFMGDAGSH